MIRNKAFSKCVSFIYNYIYMHFYLSILFCLISVPICLSLFLCMLSIVHIIFKIMYTCFLHEIRPLMPRGCNLFVSTKFKKYHVKVFLRCLNSFFSVNCHNVLSRDTLWVLNENNHFDRQQQNKQRLHRSR